MKPTVPKQKRLYPIDPGNFLGKKTISGSAMGYCSPELAAMVADTQNSLRFSANKEYWGERLCILVAFHGIRNGLGITMGKQSIDSFVVSPEE